jgi:hypothetical protein
LFTRLQHGQYLINPRLALRMEGDWRGIYDLLVPDRLGVTLRELEPWMHHDWNPNTYRETAIEQLRTMIERLAQSEDKAVP